MNSYEIEAIPICEIPEHISRKIDDNVSQILAKKEENHDADTQSLENEIDYMVYHLYDLTYDEVLIIDNNPPFTREAYVQWYKYKEL